METNKIQTPPETHQPLGPWLREDLAVSVPRYGVIGAAIAVLALLLVAID